MSTIPDMSWTPRAAITSTPHDLGRGLPVVRGRGARRHGRHRHPARRRQGQPAARHPRRQLAVRDPPPLPRRDGVLGRARGRRAADHPRPRRRVPGQRSRRRPGRAHATPRAPSWPPTWPRWIRSPRRATRPTTRRTRRCPSGGRRAVPSSTSTRSCPNTGVRWRATATSCSHPGAPEPRPGRSHPSAGSTLSANSSKLAQLTSGSSPPMSGLNSTVLCSACNRRATPMHSSGVSTA